MKNQDPRSASFHTSSVEKFSIWAFSPQVRVAKNPTTTAGIAICKNGMPESERVFLYSYTNNTKPAYYVVLRPCACRLSFFCAFTREIFGAFPDLEKKRVFLSTYLVLVFRW